MARMTPAARVAFALAASEAEELGSESLEVEHLLIGLCKLDALSGLRDGEVPGLAREDLDETRRDANAFLELLRGSGADPVRTRRRLRQVWTEARPERRPFSGHRSPLCRLAFARAAELAEGPIGVFCLAYILLEKPTPLVERVLSEEKVERAVLLRTLRERLPAPRAAPPPAEAPRKAVPAAPGRRPSAERLSRFGRDLTWLARQGKLRLATGRDEETKQVARILMQAKKGNPLLVGEAGVGKTAIVEGLAVKLLQPEIPKALRELHLVELSMGSLVAGTTYRGEFEERMQKVLKELEGDPVLVVFLDEIHMLLGAGKVKGSAMDAANLLKPALARGSIRCIGATTVAEYRQFIEEDPALERRFQALWIEEPSHEATLQILEALKPSLEEHHGVAIARAALVKAVELSVRYLPDFRLPDKAIDLVDQACARALLSTFSRPAPGEGRPASMEIGADDIAEAVALRCRVPVERLTTDEGQRLLRMEEELGRRVIGQPQALQAVSEALRAARAGLGDPRRPRGVFLFLGPTGTGKTELAKALAEFLFDDERRLIRIDMSELQEEHAVARLIGSPPGYKGHDEGGQLVNQVRSQPYSVVLLDEIEKAHPKVLDVLLQVFDEGQLTDGRGRRASFREAIIIMTSNLGSRLREQPPRRAIGLAREPEGKPPAEQGERDREAALARFLRPELRNRIQREIVFTPLDRAAIERITDKVLDRVRGALAGRGLTLELTESARQLLMAEGFSEAFGARAMERAVRDLLEAPLSRLLLEMGDRPPGCVRVTADGMQMRFELAG